MANNFNLFDFSKVNKTLNPIGNIVQQPKYNPLGSSQPAIAKSGFVNPTYVPPKPIQNPIRKPEPSNLFIPTANADESEQKPSMSFDQTDINNFRDLMSRGIDADRAKRLIVQSKQDKISNEPVGMFDALGNIISGSAQKTAEAFKGGIERIGEAGEGLASGKYNIMEAGARGGLGAIEAATSPIAGVGGEAIQRLIVDPITGLTPQGVKSDIGQNIVEPAKQDIMNWYNKLPEDAKREAENIGIGTQLLANFTGAKVAPSVVNTVSEAATPVLETAENIGNKALKFGKEAITTTPEQRIAKNIAKATEYITPESPTPSMLKELNAQGATETGKGILGNKVKVLPDAVIPGTKGTLSQIGEASSDFINPKSTVSENINKLKTGIKKEAGNLRSAILESDALIPRKKMVGTAQKALDLIKDNPEIVGESELMANKMLEKWKSLVTNSKGSASGLLDARQAFDDYMNTFNPSDIGKKSIKNTVWKAIRNSANDLIEEVTPASTAVKQSLRKQSLLYDAIDLISGKKESNILGKVIKHPVGKAAAAATLGATGYGVLNH